MQHTLTFVKDKIKYVSKPFDFEAMCIINDAHNEENKKGPLPPDVTRFLKKERQRKNPKVQDTSLHVRSRQRN